MQLVPGRISLQLIPLNFIVAETAVYRPRLKWPEYGQNQKSDD